MFRRALPHVRGGRGLCKRRAAALHSIADASRPRALAVAAVTASCAGALVLVLVFAARVGAWGYSGRLAVDPFVVGAPEQISLTFGATPNGCVVSWVSSLTPRDTPIRYYPSIRAVNGNNASVYYGEVKLLLKGGADGPHAVVRHGYSSIYTESRCGTSRLQTAAQAAAFEYQVSNVASIEGSLVRVAPMSDTLTATVPLSGSPSAMYPLLKPSTQHPPLRVALVADMSIDYPGGHCIQSILQRRKSVGVDLFISVGDVAYNADDDCGDRGDDFFRALQPLTSAMPSVFVVGDHEGFRKDIDNDCRTRTGYDYEAYRNRMGESTWAGQLTLAHASSSGSAFYFSWDTRLVHWVAINTNAWVYACQYWMLRPQFQFLEADLQAVDRKKTPWVVLLAHRGMYCVNSNSSECNQDSESMRHGVPEHAYRNNIGMRDWAGPVKGQANMYGLEALLQRFRVDLVYSGHSHHYERSFPSRDGVPVQYDTNSPRAPVYVVGGMSGQVPDPFRLPPAAFTAYRDASYATSWSHVTILDANTLLFEQVAAQNGTVFDSFRIVKP
eukprot:CAMPEP_0177636822 /NCGR_PEP_ID=MMETSP0447-20121125/4640_1 /TAXON_ID=0 /ORGANISM="Stygamoeba regulata, Strain BSH-02190019" /LENGTH=554 /DNA_ID=CAMNT_0019138703 /DNA_START=43 /DNA_END=1706 /DNA_ORIENTATION=+